MIATHLSVVVLLIGFLVENGVCITCFECDSMTDYRCDFPVRLKATDTEFIQTGCTFCHSIQANPGDAYLTVRDCITSTSSPTGTTGCIKGTYGAVEGTECVCKSDLCNTDTGTGLRCDRLVPIILFAVALLCYSIY